MCGKVKPAGPAGGTFQHQEIRIVETDKVALDDGYDKEDEKG